jgi:CheY-like chemotaxis protein
MEDSAMVPTLAPLRMLVVDDSDDAAMTMALLLKHFGHEAAVMESGELALRQAPAFRPHVMFIDLAMPKVDGLTVARQLRQQSEFAEIPMVAVSGYVDAEHRAQATAAGFTEFLAKPYSLDTLQATVQRVANRLNASRERIDTSRLVAAQAGQLNRAMQESLAEDRRNRYPRGPVSVRVEKSGISNMLTMPERSSAEDLRQWLKGQCCRVGPIFEPAAGQFGFYCYSKRHSINELIAKHGGFNVNTG